MNNKPELLAAAFIHHLTYERRLSPLTSQNYARDIRILLKHLNKDNSQKRKDWLDFGRYERN